MANAVFTLDTSTGVPFYRQIIDQILLSVADGRLKPGAKLPTVRQLAVDLSVNLNTVARAYREMEIRGIVETQQGTGTFIAARAAEKRSGARRKAISVLVDRCITNATTLGVSTDELIDALIERAEKDRKEITMVLAVVVPMIKKEKDPEAGGGRHVQSRAGADDVAGGARRHVNGVSFTVYIILTVVSVLAIAMTEDMRLRLGLFFLFQFLSFYFLFSIKIARQWEKAVILRFGRFVGLKGPGLFSIIPIVDVVSHLIDQRVRVTDVTAESALTRDTVPVDVDAIVFWTVWDAEKAVLEVSDYFLAIALSAQTGLREAIGRHELAEMITERERLGAELRKILDDKTNAWGITVHSVEIRDVKIPPALEDAMSRQAQAERERQARIILGTAETEIAARFVKAGDEYTGRPVALHLRAMNMLYEAIKEKGSMVIVPSSAVETMGLGGLSGLTALSVSSSADEGPFRSEPKG